MPQENHSEQDHQGAPSGAREWLRSVPAHPALVILAVVCLLIIIIVFLLARPGTPQRGALEAWGGVPSATVDSTQYAPQQSSHASGIINSSATTSLSPMYIPPSTLDSDSSLGAPSAGTEADLDAMLAALSSPKTGVASTSTVDSSLAYSFIPQGLISTSTVPLSPKRSATQQELFDYGNNAGGYIQSYENSHRAIVQTLTDEIADRYNAQKVQAVRDIGDALISVGKRLESIDPIPASAQFDNAALAAAYENIGEKLKVVANAKTDQELLTAVNTYNAAADTFGARYRALAQLFVISGVQFSAIDSGSAFTFTNTQGL